ncbi:fosfomycin resistance glutathione transferase [Bowmanella denitrificans]|uniref:fosfomycin resistance glutathione transferase n=1 Tax=Bowmanella denitrificans TaxID=366582 RepID=UPI000C9BD962|nr:fosfomycin resistance glutathione transferase [Bowmanella denitrificans]
MLKGLNHITVAVADLDRSLHFYLKVLGFSGHVRWDKGAYLSLGELWLCLSVDTPAPAQDYSHLAFTLAAEDFAAFRERLQQNNTPIWKDNHSEGASVYFLDPDGHKLEAHEGSLASRLQSLHKQPYSGLSWL